jgi:hypothetical protein
MVKAVPYRKVSAASPPQPAGRRGQMKAALHAHGGQRHQAGHGHGGGGAHAAVQVAGLVLGQHQRQAEGAGGRQRKRHAGANAPPLAGRAQARCRAQHIQRQRQARQDDRHGDQHGPLGPLAVHHPGPQRRPDRVGVEGQQRQRHRQARHGRIQAQALHADQQADERQHALVARGECHAHTLRRQDGHDHQRGDGAAEHDGGGHVGPVVEGNARGHMVGAHHQRDEQQRGKGGGAERAGGWGHEGGVRTGWTDGPGRPWRACRRRWPGGIGARPPARGSWRRRPRGCIAAPAPPPPERPCGAG